MTAKKIPYSCPLLVRLLMFWFSLFMIKTAQYKLTMKDLAFVKKKVLFAIIPGFGGLILCRSITELLRRSHALKKTSEISGEARFKPRTAG